jgi:hypothetical protein
MTFFGVTLTLFSATISQFLLVWRWELYSVTLITVLAWRCKRTFVSATHLSDGVFTATACHIFVHQTLHSFFCYGRKKSVVFVITHQIDQKASLRHFRTRKFSIDPIPATKFCLAANSHFRSKSGSSRSYLVRIVHLGPYSETVVTCDVLNWVWVYCSNFLQSEFDTF